MSFVDLRSFVAALEKRGDLVRVSEEVSSVLEITEIHNRLLKTRGQAVVFEKVVTENGPSSMPVLTNLFGTVDRVAYGLGVEFCNLREIGKLLAFLRSPTPPESFGDILNFFPILKNIVAARTKIVKKAPCQEVIITGENVDLRALPIQTCWPGEPAPLITWPIVITQGPSSAREDKFNLGVYRMQVVDERTTIMRWLKHRGGAMQYSRWKKVGKGNFPVAVVIGSDPATMISAVTPIPETISEYQFAGILRNKPTELVECITVPLKVPANSEIVLEGFVSVEELLEEGPYGDHTGYYNSVEKFPKFSISCMTMRRDPLYLSTFTGRPPDECSVLGEALNELFVPLLIAQYPEIVDFWLPPEGCSYRIAVVSIKKSYPGHAKTIVMGVLSYLKQFMYIKFVIVVDDDICVRDWKDVIWAISSRMDPSRDIIFIDNSPIDYLDFASIEDGLGSKVGLDATNKIYPETKRVWGIPIRMSEDIVEKVSEKWSKYGLGNTENK